jgi:DNA-binding XRE family transcriptional regulator
MLDRRMPYIDDFKTLRERAGQRKSVVAKTAGLSADTIDRIEKHQNSTRPTLAAVVNALNTLHYHRPPNVPLDPDLLITESSRFGSTVGAQASLPRAEETANE